jgi:glycosyltransferase involved in cell wall biosynthesis
MTTPGAAPRSGRKVRLLYVVSQPVRWVAFEWLAGGLDREAFDLSFVLLSKGPAPLAPHLEARGVPVHQLPYPGRRALPRAVRAVARHCRAHAVDIVHAHFMDACLAGLLGARLAGVPVRLHTRHHAGPYPCYHRPPWGAWYDRWNNRLSTAVIAPSAQARRALLGHDGVLPAKVVTIPHGFDLAALASAGEAGARRMRAKYGLGQERPVVGVVARYERIKGVAYVIDAFRRLLGSYPSARLVLANARGRWAGPVRRRLGLLPASRYVEIPFEQDMPALFRTFDVFVHAPIHPRLEAFGQVYVEAMAAGVPCVCTVAGVAGEYVVDGENAVVVGPEDSGQIHRGLLRVLGDADLRGRLIANARRSVEERFGLGRMLRSLETLYLRLHAGPGGAGE